MSRSAIAVLALMLVQGSAPFSATASSPQCLTDTGQFVVVPGGRTQIGDDEGYADERPAYLTHVGSFAIRATEVTVEEFAEFAAATDYVTTAERRGSSLVFSPPEPGQLPTDPAGWWKIVDGANWRHPEGPASSIIGRGKFPVTHVSFSDAQAFARWRGERLPTEEEFERAARAGLAPTSQQPSPDSANTWQGPFPYANLAKDRHSGIAPAGCFKPSAYGLHDVIGNVWEWTSSYYLPGHGPEPSALGEKAPLSFDPNQPGVEVRVIKGGSFLCAPNYCARYRPSARHAQARDETASHIGFRTVRKL
jgi:sulfatase modifying factor 1